MNTYQFIITIFLMSIMTSGLGNLYMYLIRRGNMLDFMQKILSFLEPKKSKFYKLIYKSIGGCNVCTIQRFSDVVYIILSLTIGIKLNIIILFLLYCLFGGSVFYFSRIFNLKSEVKKIKTDIEI